MAVLDLIQTFSTFTHKCVFQSSVGPAASVQLCDALNHLCNIIKNASVVKL